MPHSTIMEIPEVRDEIEISMTSEDPTDVPQEVEVDVSDTQTLKEESQEHNVGDRDIIMTESDAESKIPSVKEEIKPEVKLEDLFADVESDEEFPSSAGQDIKTMSSPQAPASPM